MNSESKILITIGFITGLVLLGAVWVFNASNKSIQTAPLTSDAKSKLVQSDSPAQGPADAKVTIVEFLDPECEACRAMFPVVKQLMKEYEGKVRLVVRYFPLHSNSVLAASATEAAGRQGKYWEMQEKLFEKQSEWGEKREPQTALMMQYAEELGLDKMQFEKVLSDLKIAEKVQRDRADGVALGVRGTPTFFINGVKLESLSAEVMKSMIEQSLSK